MANVQRRRRAGNDASTSTRQEKRGRPTGQDAREAKAERPTEPALAPPYSPTWAKWASCVGATLPQAVALSSNLDPEDPGVAWHAKARLTTDALELVLIPGPSSLSYLPEDRLAQFQERFDIAVNHVQDGRLKTSTGTPEGSVHLADFARWAQGLKWTLPPEFPTTSGASSNDQPRKRAGDLTKERKTLLKIIAGLAKHADVDIGQPTKAAGVIVAALQTLGVKIGSRTVEECLKEIDDAIT